MLMNFFDLVQNRFILIQLVDTIYVVHHCKNIAHKQNVREGRELNIELTLLLREKKNS